MKTEIIEGIDGSDLGTVAGELYEDAYADGANLLGALSYGNLGPADELSDELLASIGFGVAYDLHGEGLPALKADPSIEGTGTLKVHSNDGTGRSKEFEISLGLFNGGDVAAGFLSEAGLLVGESYAPDRYEAYRWYAPLNADIDLYDIWYDPSPIVGWHLGRSSYNPEIYFGADGSYVMMEYDGHSQTGSYWTDGTYLIFEGGNYDGVIVTLGEGTMSFPDVNDDSYVYEYAKAPLYYGYYTDGKDYTLYLGKNGTSYVDDGMSKLDVSWRLDGGELYLTVASYDEAKVAVDGDTLSFTLNDYDYSYDYVLTAFDGIPSYDGGYVGLFHGKDYDYRLYDNGNIDIYRTGQTSLYYTGGYRAFGTSLEIDAFGLSASEFRYDGSKGVIYATDGSILMAKEGAYLDRHATADSSLAVFRFALEETTVSYILKNGRLIDGSVEGGTILIAGESYILTNGTLVPASEIGTDTSSIAGTYDLSVNGNPAILLVVADDGTGTYDGESVEFAWNGQTLLFTTSGDLYFELTYDEAEGTFSGLMDGEYPVEVVPHVESLTFEGLAGVYELHLPYNDLEVAIRPDGTGTCDGVEVSFVLEGATISWTSNYIDYELTYENGLFSGTYDDGDYVFNVTMEYVGPLEEETPGTNESTLLGTWTGTIIGGTTWNLEVKEGGSLTLTVGDTPFEGTWTGDLSGTISFAVPSFSELNGTLTLNSDGGASLEAEDWDYYTYSIEMTRLA